MARSPRQEALRAKSKKISNPVQGNKDEDYTLDKRDEGYYHVRYTPLRVTKVGNKSRVVELEDVASTQKHRPEVFEELEFRGALERKDLKVTILHDPTLVAPALTPQQRAAITRKENEEKKRQEEEAKAK